MGSTGELKDYRTGETFRTSRNPIEPYLSPFIAVTTSHRRSADNFIPREKSCVDFPFDLSIDGRWQKLDDTGSLEVCAIGSSFARHIVVIHRAVDPFFSRAILRGIKFHSSRKYVAISSKRRDDTITYTAA